jgi:hypothetical protein
MQLPNAHAMVVLVVTLVALARILYLYPFDMGRYRVGDVEVLLGFRHPVLLAILCLIVLGRGSLATGALEPVVRVLTQLWKWSQHVRLLPTARSDCRL